MPKPASKPCSWARTAGFSCSRVHDAGTSTLARAGESTTRSRRRSRFSPVALMLVYVVQRQVLQLRATADACWSGSTTLASSTPSRQVSADLSHTEVPRLQRLQLSHLYLEAQGSGKQQSDLGHKRSGCQSAVPRETGGNDTLSNVLCSVAARAQEEGKKKAATMATCSRESSESLNPAICHAVGPPPPSKRPVWHTRSSSDQRPRILYQFG